MVAESTLASHQKQLSPGGHPPIQTLGDWREHSIIPSPRGWKPQTFRAGGPHGHSRKASGQPYMQGFAWNLKKAEDTVPVTQFPWVSPMYKEDYKGQQSNFTSTLLNSSGWSYGWKRDHILNWQAQGRPTWQILQTQRLEGATQDGLNLKGPNEK